MTTRLDKAMKGLQQLIDEGDFSILAHDEIADACLEACVRFKMFKADEVNGKGISERSVKNVVIDLLFALTTEGS